MKASSVVEIGCRGWDKINKVDTPPWVVLLRDLVTQSFQPLVSPLNFRGNFIEEFPSSRILGKPSN